MSLQRRQDAAPRDMISGLGDDILMRVFGYIGKRSYRTVAGTSPRFRALYRQIDTYTSAEELVQTPAGAELFCNEAGVASMFSVRLSVVNVECPNALTLVAFTAVFHGNMEMLNWARARNFNFQSVFSFFLAASKEHFHVLEWLVQNGSVVEAAYDQELEDLLLSHRLQSRSGFSAGAPNEREEKVLQWLRHHRSP